MFPVEPASNDENFVSPLQGLQNVILTPHIGGSTEEAQERIGAEVARKLIDYSDIGSTLRRGQLPAGAVAAASRPARASCTSTATCPACWASSTTSSRARGVNIAAQYLQTDGEIGYVVIEADGTREDCEQVLEEIRDTRRHHPRPHHLRALTAVFPRQKRRRETALFHLERLFLLGDDLVS